MSRKKKKAGASVELTATALGHPGTTAALAAYVPISFTEPDPEPQAIDVATPRRRVSGDEVREIRRQQRREERIAEKGY